MKKIELVKVLREVVEEIEIAEHVLTFAVVRPRLMRKARQFLKQRGGDEK